jgi:hypothetical protein
VIADLAFESPRTRCSSTESNEVWSAVAFATGTTISSSVLSSLLTLAVPDASFNCECTILQLQYYSGCWISSLSSSIPLIVRLQYHNMYALPRKIWRTLKVLLVWGTTMFLFRDHIFMRYFNPLPKYMCESSTGELFNGTLETIFPLWSVNIPYLWNTRIRGSHRAKAPSYVALRECHNTQNGYIRLPNPFYNISMATSSERSDDRGRFWNPTIVALPA